MTKSKSYVIGLILGSLPLAAHAADLYVAPNGNDATEYAAVSIDSPWQTLNHAIYNLRAGDTLYVRGGTYVPAYPMLTKSDYTSKTKGGNPLEDMNAESGTAALKVRITGYPGEQVIIDLGNVPLFIRLDNMSYWIFEDLTFINTQTVFAVGEDLPTRFNEFRRLAVKMKYGGDNAAAIKLINGNSEGTVVENCVIEGPGTGPTIHANTGGIFARIVNNLTIRNNDISNAPFGIYFKHANTPVTADYSDVRILIENNFIHSVSRAGIETNSNGAIFRNNVFGQGGLGIKNNEANGIPGGDRNTYEHNTFYSGSLFLTADTQAGDPLPGSIGNIVFGNVFLQQLNVHRYSAATHDTESDWNLYSPAMTHIENRIEYSLSGWVAHTGQDRSSMSGTPQFSGSDFNDPLSFALTEASPGKRLNQGRDAGADVTLVGSSIEVPTVIQLAPAAPADLQ